MSVLVMNAQRVGLLGHVCALLALLGLVVLGLALQHLHLTDHLALAACALLGAGTVALLVVALLDRRPHIQG